MTLISGHKFNSSPNADPDARRYLNAANIVPGQVYAGDGNNDFPLNSERVIVGVTNFYKALKANGLQSKATGLYFFLGNTQLNNFVNGLNPGYKNLTLVPTSPISFVRSGMVCTNANISTGRFLSDFTENSFSIGIYIKNSSGGKLFGATDKATGLAQLSASPFFLWFKNNSNISVSSTFANGFHLMSITAANRNAYFVNGVQTVLDTHITTYHNSDFRELWLGQVNSTDTYNSTGTGNGQFGFSWFGSGLSDADAIALSTLVESLMFEIWGRDLGLSNNKVIQFLGDSLTVNVANVVATGYHPWTNHVCYWLKAFQRNYAIGGTTIIDCNNTQILNIVPKDATHTRVVIAFGTNDFGNDVAFGHAMTLSIFSSTFAAVYNKLFTTYGYSPSDIVVITGYLINAYQYDGALGGAGRGDALQDSYIAANYAAAKTANIPDSNIFNFKLLAENTIGSAGISGIHMMNGLHDICGEYTGQSLVQSNF
jgi:hypothetical protein